MELTAQPLQAYLIMLGDGRELVFRIARRHMPRLKTESEVATLNYVRLHTAIPVPFVHHYDANPINRIGGEYILMSKAPGVPLSKHYYHLSGDTLRKLLRNVAELLIPLFSHRFPKTGSLYMSRPLKYYQTRAPTGVPPTGDEFFVGPIVSWAFFGGGRGEESSIDRGPWSSTKAYLTSATEREIDAVRAEGSGHAHHRPHLPPEDYEYDSSTDVSDNEDEHWRTARWARGAGGISDSDSDPGEVAYRDYRRTQRGSFLVAHTMQRVEKCKNEMARFLRVMESLGAYPSDGKAKEEFSLDMHDISLQNIFVDEEDPSKITCVIDWESTTVRPLWFCAHVPSFLEHAYPHPQLPPNVSASSVFWQEASKIAGVGAQWAQAEQEGQALRVAHKVIEWDGWEEGLVATILGDEEDDEGEPTQRPPSHFGTVVPATDGGLVVVNSRSPRSGIGFKGGGGLNGNGANKAGAGVDLALLNGVEERLRKNGLLEDGN